jgi:hypothetical protein
MHACTPSCCRSLLIAQLISRTRDAGDCTADVVVELVHLLATHTHGIGVQQLRGHGEGGVRDRSTVLCMPLSCSPWT